MKILNIMLGKGMGGIEQAFCDYTQLLHGKTGFEGDPIEIIQITARNAAIKSKLDPKARHYELNMAGGDYNIFSLYRLRQIIKRQQPAFILCHSNRASKYGKRAAKGLNLPVIGIAHRHQLDYIQRLDYIFTVNDDIADELYRRGVPQSRIFVIYNMLSPNLAAHIKQTPPVQKILPKAPEAAVLGVMGRLEKVKGQDIMLDALHILHQYYDSPLNLRFAGTGSLRPKLIEQAQSLGLTAFVAFEGWAGDQARFYETIDLLIVPSRFESFGMIIIEAMAFGVPVIAASTKGATLLIKDGVSGSLVETENPAALAHEIYALLNDEERRRQYRTNAKLNIKPYLPDQIFTRITAAFDAIAALGDLKNP